MTEPYEFDVFVSYSSDDREAVRKLAERLHNDGLRVWLDIWQINVGDLVPKKIDKGLERSRTLIFCMSSNSYGASWATYELYAARFCDPANDELSFIPVRLDDSPVPKGLQAFRHVNWGPTVGDLEQEYANLLAACRRSAERPYVRRRVCMISSEYSPLVLGGLGVHVTQLTRALMAYADVDLILPYHSDRYSATSPGPSTHKVVNRVSASYDDPLSWIHFARDAFATAKSIKSKPDVVHCHDWVTVLAGIKCKLQLEIPLIFHVHLPNRSPLCSSVENLGLLYADLVTVNSQAMAAQLRDRFPDKEITVVPNGVDTSVFVPSGDYQRKDKYVLFVGRLVEQKGVDYLLRAFVHVLRRFPDYELWIAGDGEWRQAYKRLAECLLIDKQVKFLGFQKNDSDLVKLYQSAAVVAVPSIFEPFGMTALEGMACGTAVVASRTGGLEEIIDPGVTGILAEPGDHLDLAQWIIRLIDDEPYRQKLGTNAAARIHGKSSEYHWPSVARKYAEFYNKLSFKTIDSNRPDGASLYQNQIAQLASAMDPSLEGQRQLFNWIYK